MQTNPKKESISLSILNMSATPLKKKNLYDTVSKITQIAL